MLRNDAFFVFRRRLQAMRFSSKGFGGGWGGGGSPLIKKTHQCPALQGITTTDGLYTELNSRVTINFLPLFSVKVRFFCEHKQTSYPGFRCKEEKKNGSQFEKPHLATWMFELLDQRPPPTPYAGLTSTRWRRKPTFSSSKSAH